MFRAAEPGLESRPQVCRQERAAGTARLATVPWAGAGPWWRSFACSGCLATEAILLVGGAGCGWAAEGGEQRQVRPAGRVLRSPVRVGCAWTLLHTCQTWSSNCF